MPTAGESLPSAGKRFLQSRLLGYLVLCGVIFIWAGFALTLRSLENSPLAAVDVALFRMLIPLGFLLPCLPRRLPRLRVLPPGTLVLVALGGAPFFLVAHAGAESTSAADVSALIAGTAPLVVALLRAGFEKHRPASWGPLLLIPIGAALLIASHAHAIDAEMIRGWALLLLASLLWASYTLGLRRSGLDALSNTLLVSILSLPLLGLLLATSLTPSHFDHWTWSDARPFVLIQGLGAGLFSNLGYAFAVRRLGAPTSATLGALTPALTALLAVPLLHEPLPLIALAGIFIIALGVALSQSRHRLAFPFLKPGRSKTPLCSPPSSQVPIDRGAP
ncbi:drug/metabolite transporter (DMT)-like permease [Haloferula luteola]|uniref:Drug/metabolite transporter (DMT)-like permease n=1 Tax=Haloferula luteola TaxID=595692 RepID=A0A840VHR7_9BACT|nr:DMT family transporter [Haloferula luteola]MBB5353380.1 drug/metabolite transporter (DMT)-like permease [Haloferula luteola]